MPIIAARRKSRISGGTASSVVTVETRTLPALWLSARAMRRVMSLRGHLGNNLAAHRNAVNEVQSDSSG